MAKFIIRTPRYIDGLYHHASPDSPKVVEIPDKYSPSKDPTLEPFKGKEPEPAHPTRHFHDARGPNGAVSAAAHFSKKKGEDGPI